MDLSLLQALERCCIPHGFYLISWTWNGGVFWAFDRIMGRVAGNILEYLVVLLILLTFILCLILSYLTCWVLLINTNWVVLLFVLIICVCIHGNFRNGKTIQWWSSLTTVRKDLDSTKYKMAITDMVLRGTASTFFMTNKFLIVL